MNTMQRFALLVSATVVLSGFAPTTFAGGFGRFKIFNITPNVSKILQVKKPKNPVKSLPKNTLVTDITIAEEYLPKDPKPFEAAKFLVSIGVDCCQPLEHAYADWYWCCDKSRLIQIKSRSDSTKAALIDIMARASKLDDKGWEKVRRETSPPIRLS
jgi:hypothetical protein